MLFAHFIDEETEALGGLDPSPGVKQHSWDSVSISLATKPQQTFPTTAHACLPVALWSALHFSCDSVTFIGFLANKRGKAKPRRSLGTPPEGNPGTTAHLLLLTVLERDSFPSFTQAHGFL